MSSVASLTIQSTLQGRIMDIGEKKKIGVRNPLMAVHVLLVCSRKLFYDNPLPVSVCIPVGTAINELSLA